MSNLSWNEVEKSAQELADKIKASNFEPDYLIGIAIGGLIPLGLLAKKLDINDIATITVSSYDGRDKKELEITYLPKIDLSNKKVLLVDEIAETGETLKQICDILTGQYGVKELKTATLGINKEKCKFRPDFAALEANDWIVFPWEE